METEPGERIYEMPYIRLPNTLGDVLIIGAGSGSDVAIALRERAAGRCRRHRSTSSNDRQGIDRPYSIRVTTHTNDGRAFGGPRTGVCLILLPCPFADPVSGASQIRLESFLFTQEALHSVRDHLKPNGAFAMYNYYRENWLIDRLAGTAATAFGHTPCVDKFGEAQAVVSIAVVEADQQCGKAWTPAAAVVPPASDNAPFLYFRGGAIPSLYLVTLLGILLTSLVAVRTLGGPLSQMRPYADLFFMGSAFLLRRRRMSPPCVAVRATWFVNALVFGGILIVVLAAVETTRKFRTPSLPVIFGGIAASLALAWIIRPEWLLPLPFAPRLIAATTLAFLPIFLANVAFAKRFQGSSDSQEAFAVNLLGAMVGGCLEYGALITGYNNLLLVTGLLYLIAFLLIPRSAAQQA
jgi:hypothetical protein